MAAIKLKKVITPTLNTRLDYQIEFSNPLYHPHMGHLPILSSTEFSYIYGNDLYLDCSLDDEDGIVRVIQTNADGSKTVIKNSGTINYDSGLLNLEDFIPYSINDGSTTVKITVQPRVNDIVPAFNQLVSIDSGDVTITLIDDTQLVSTDRPGVAGSFVVSRGITHTTDTGDGSGEGGAGSPRGGY